MSDCAHIRQQQVLAIDSGHCPLCLRASLAAAEAERDHLRLQAQMQAQEMRTQRAIVRDCYRAATGATGEPGDWNGAAPIKALVAERDTARAAYDECQLRLAGLEAERDHYREALAEMTTKRDALFEEATAAKRELAEAQKESELNIAERKAWHKESAAARAEAARLREMVREAYSEGQSSVGWSGSTPFKDSSVAYDLAALDTPAREGGEA